MGQFQHAINHSSSASEAKCATGSFQTRETIHDFAQTATIQLGQLAEIENDAVVAVAKQFVERQLELFAFDSNLERTRQLKDGDSPFEFFFDDLQRYLPTSFH